MRIIASVLLVVCALGLVAGCVPDNTNPIIDIPANQPDRNGGDHTDCAVEEVPGIGGPYKRVYNERTGVRYSDIFGCLSGWDPDSFQGEPGRSPYDTRWIVEIGDPLGPVTRDDLALAA